jgi:hypothetical protein
MTQQQVVIENREIVQSRTIPFDGLSVVATTSGAADVFATANSRNAMQVKRLVACNTSGTAATLSLHAVPSGGSVTNDNAQLVGYSIAANAAVDLTDLIGGYYAQGTELRVWAGTTDVITLSGHWVDIF